MYLTLQLLSEHKLNRVGNIFVTLSAGLNILAIGIRAGTVNKRTLSWSSLVNLEKAGKISALTTV
jgi:hypothetical protein